MEVDSDAPASQAWPQEKLKQGVIVPEDSPFDLEQVAAQYEGQSTSAPVHLLHNFCSTALPPSGRTKVTRLNHIANSSPSLAGPALTLTLASIKADTLDTTLYESTFSSYRQCVNSIATGENKDPLAVAWHQSVKGKEVPIDRVWLEKTRREAQSGIDKLEVELKGYTTNLIKESIRMGHRDLARFLYRTGDFQGAIRSYTKSREFCTTNHHVLEMCLGIIEVAFEVSNYSFVRNYVVKAESALDAINSPSQSGKTKPAPTNLPGMLAPGMDPVEAAKEKEKLSIQERLTIANGVAFLGMNNYDRAARAFTGVGKETLSSQIGHFIPPADIALYAVMTGLASFTREEIKRKLLENADLRPMLDVEPYLRDILRAFYENRFKEGLGLLEKHSVRQLLDVHLHTHVPRLMQLIRSRALLVYFQPYSSVSIGRMATAFGFTDSELRTSVTALINTGEFKARIDNQASVFVARKKDVRAEAFKKALEEGEKIQRRTVAAELRMRLIQADVVVKGPKNSQEAY
ncbi:COP9 signalosome complex subunit 1, partial [Phenoliferia sp. Uapishka_3]